MIGHEFSGVLLDAGSKWAGSFTGCLKQITSSGRPKQKSSCLIMPGRFKASDLTIQTKSL